MVFVCLEKTQKEKKYYKVGGQDLNLKPGGNTDN